MGHRRLAIAFALVCACTPTSGVDPNHTGTDLTDDDVRALCRFQHDLLGEGTIECEHGTTTFQSYEECLVSLPHSIGGPCGFSDVAHFEECTRALAGDPCGEPDSCAVSLCL